jgi:RHS repeat-associated protein
VHYVYDFDNRRLYKKFFRWENAQANWIEQESHRYLYVGKNEVGTVDSTGKIIELRILGLTQGAEVGSAVAHEKEGQLYVPEHDHQGHVVMLLDLATGAPQEIYRFSAFGSEQLYDANGNALQTPRSPWRFASKRYDPESGFVYFGERYYGPASCRWITPDPLGAADGPNLYAYVKNNPLMNIDPDGLFATTAYQKIESFALDIFNSHQFQGGLQTMGGAAQVGVGLALCETVVGAPLGALAIAHGADNMQAGIQQALFNKAVDPLTVQGLQATGMTRSNALLVNGGLSMALAGSSAVLASKATALPSMRLASMSVAKGGVNLDLDALSKAGRVMDRNGLTKAGRALDKHGGRPDSVFPKATGSPTSKSVQGQYHLDDILTHQSTSYPNRFGGQDIFLRDGRGARFDAENNFVGFLQPKRIE